MPELPEVQTTVDGINRLAKGETIRDVWTSYKSSYHKNKDNIKDPKYFGFFKSKVNGKKIIKASRRAKNIMIELSSKDFILIHLKMTGHLLYGRYEMSGNTFISKDKNLALKDPFNRHIRFLMKLSSGNSLALSDTRKFAKVTLIDNSKLSVSSHLKDIGPEPLEKTFDLKSFKEKLGKKPNMKIKTALMDQSLIAGIGNIYSDEILWHSDTNPERKVSTISDTEFQKMFKAMKSVLKKGIDFGGDSMSDYRNILGERGKFQEQHNAYRLKGTKCKKPTCKGEIVRKIVGGRSAHYCIKHQK